ncbi:MAG: hypothetical protein ACW979_09640 [Candidatus Thorarchaeota archaeon]
MADKLDYKIVGLAIIFLLCWMGYSPIACRSTVVWSDDFNEVTMMDGPSVITRHWGKYGPNPGLMVHSGQLPITIFN